MNPITYLVDIDGTLADPSHRLHWIKVAPKDWDMFFYEAKDDAPISQVIGMVNDLEKHNYIILVTGRPERLREITKQWLKDNGVIYDELWMRKDGDHRQDYIVKSELLDAILADDPATSITDYIAIEDRKQVVDMYRSRGIKTLQVADGDF